MTHEERPWGHFTILLDASTHKVKELVVRPGHRLSYQRHQHRAEHWFIAQGEAIILIDDEELRLSTGASLDIQAKTKHRIGNAGTKDLVFIEVQTGTYFGEDDIERLSDDYARA